MSVEITGVEIHSFAKQCLLVFCGPSLLVPQSDLSDKSLPINDLWMMRVWQIVILSVSGSKISYAKLELFLLVAREFTWNLRWLSTGIKWGKRNTCAVKEALAVWLTGKQPTRVLWIPCAQIFWFTNSVTLPIYSLQAFTDATSSLPIYSVRAFSDETSSLPTYSVRALLWQIEIWSAIYTVYFNRKYFISPFFIYARTLRMPPRDIASRQNPCGGN